MPGGAEAAAGRPRAPRRRRRAGKSRSERFEDGSVPDRARALRCRLFRGDTMESPNYTQRYGDARLPSLLLSVRDGFFGLTWRMANMKRVLLGVMALALACGGAKEQKTQPAADNSKTTPATSEAPKGEGGGGGASGGGSISGTVKFTGTAP